MVDEISSRDWESSVKDLEQLESFYAFCKEPDKKMEEIWEKYRLLPLPVAYLIASHHQYDVWGWSLKTKWNLVTQFDEILKKEKNCSKISDSVASAIETQRKIVHLKKLFATLTDPTQSLQNKTVAYQDVKIKHPGLYQEIIHNLWVYSGKPSSKDSFEIETQMLQKPDHPDHQAVIKKMIFLYVEGHRYLQSHFFEKKETRAAG